MIRYLLFCVAGAYIGHKIKLSEGSVSVIQKLQTIAVLLILFFMGINLGSNEKLLSNLGSLGAQSVVFAVSSIVFSVGLVYLFEKLFMKEKEDEEIKD